MVLNGSKFKLYSICCFLPAAYRRLSGNKNKRVYFVFLTACAIFVPDLYNVMLMAVLLIYR
ncbi:MAG TPA: hypothetical protein DEQ30_11435 [Porphyromonadaceae bacterium]|nr:hypothetical protein [Porphyromonadaceae bacterium]